MGCAIGGVWHKCAQWQAQEAAQPPALEEVLAVLDAAGADVSVGADGAEVDTASAAVAEAAGTAAAPPPLKSVAYQPVPLS